MDDQIGVGCCPVHLESPAVDSEHPDAEIQARRGRVEHTLRAIQTRWEADPSARWRLQAGQDRNLGEARIRPLYPDSAVLQRVHESGVPTDLNRLSSRLLVEWHGCRVLLGADLPKREWGLVGSHSGASVLGEHACAKIPHHGSAGARHELWARGRKGRVWIVAPWRKGSGHLPDFAPGEGIAHLLKHVDEVHATSLGRRWDTPSQGPTRVTRNSVHLRRLTGLRRATASVEFDPTPQQARESWVGAAFDRAGTLMKTWHGSSALVVRS